MPKSFRCSARLPYGPSWAAAGAAAARKAPQVLPGPAEAGRASRGLREALGLRASKVRIRVRKAISGRRETRVSQGRDPKAIRGVSVRRAHSGPREIRASLAQAPRATRVPRDRKGIRET